MKIYFLSSRPCALTVNDAYFGITDRFERFAELSLKDKTFIRFSPENALPVGFFLTEEIRYTPPQGCEVYLLPDGIAIYARDFPPNDFALRAVSQKRFEDVLATLFFQGQLHLSVESPAVFFVATLPPSFSKSELSMHAGLLFLQTDDSLAIYTKTGDCVFQENVLSVQVEADELHVVLPLSDLFARTAECTYTLTEAGCERTAFTLRQQRTQNGDLSAENIQSELLPYAFFESLLIGANYTEMLSDELAAKADDLASFLGNFEAVTLTNDPRVCGLVYKKAERLFEVRQYTATVEKGKIVEIEG